MKLAGGIIAILAGVISIGAALFTLFVGGVGGAVEAEGAETVVALGWGGLFFSFVVIVLGAVAIGVKGRIPGILLVIAAVAGAILGGTFVAIVMSLAAVGGILAALEKPKSIE